MAAIVPDALIAAVRSRLAAAGVALPPAAAAGPRERVAPGEPVAQRQRVASGERVASADLAARIDHTLLAAGATAAEIRKLCDEANRHGFATVCVNPGWVAEAAAAVATPVRVCCVADFPLGAGVTEVRAREAARGVEDGAAEVDVVIRIGRLRAALPAGDAADVDEAALRDVAADIAAVVRAVRGARVSLPARQRMVKVILETCLLDARQKIGGALLAAGAGADFVKTSTGFSAGGATEDDVRLLRATLGTACGVKASGGIRTREQALALLAAGADRLGCSASVAIVTAG